MEKNISFHDKQIMLGFKTIILGLVLFIIELLSIPVFGVLQKYQVNGQGFYTEFMDYALRQPYPLIFFITALIIIFGVVFFIMGYKGKLKK